MIRFRSSCRWLAIGAVCAVLAVGTGCRARQSPVGGANNPKAQAARTKAESYTVDAVMGAAEIQAQIKTSPHEGGARGPIAQADKPGPTAPISTTVPPTPPIPPVPPLKPALRPVPAPVIRERIATEAPFPTETQADEEALRVAQERVKARLAELDPPVRYTPSLTVVKNEYIRKDSRVVRRPGPREQASLKEAGYGEDQVYVEYDVEVTAEQVRELRAQERLGGTLRIFGGLAAVALAGFLFLRLDEWTKGYLTSWLACTAAALAGGVAAALLLV
jgi:hypothetical protein